ncbi:MAG: thiamine phosphate synthase [Spirochaetes bacterium]|nr:MAG: thiamine phosphate synthase [Spirochaetota bacterium]
MEISDTKKKMLSHPLYCITADKFSNGRTVLQVAGAMLDAGARIIQYREKAPSMLRKYEECIALRALTAKTGATFIVNDDIHIAMAVGADGVHIGQDDMPIEAVRTLVGDEMIIGLSTHSPEQARDAIARGADYIGVGPLFQTFTKDDVCAPVGLEYLDFAVKNVHIPFVAIGGIKLDNLREVASRGARCAALVTEIVGAADIGEAVRQALAIMAANSPQL